MDQCRLNSICIQVFSHIIALFEKLYISAFPSPVLYQSSLHAGGFFVVVFCFCFCVFFQKLM